MAWNVQFPHRAAKLSFQNLHPPTATRLPSGEQRLPGELEEPSVGGLPGVCCPEEARLGGEAVKRSHQMRWHVTITPGCSGVRGLTASPYGWLQPDCLSSLRTTSAMIPSPSFPSFVASASQPMLWHASRVVKLSCSWRGKKNSFSSSLIWAIWGKI